MVTFDPAKVRWLYVEAAYGKVLVLVYDGEQIHRDMTMDGMRAKFPLPGEGVIIKACIKLAYPEGWKPVGRDQSFGEWFIWEALPDAIRHEFQPVVCHAWSPVTFEAQDLLVSWTAQEWCPGETCGSEDEDVLRKYRERARSYGFNVLDDGYYQWRRRPDGSIVCLDYGAWLAPGEDYPWND